MAVTVADFAKALLRGYFVLAMALVLVLVPVVGLIAALIVGPFLAGHEGARRLPPSWSTFYGLLAGGLWAGLLVAGLLGLLEFLSTTGVRVDILEAGMLGPLALMEVALYWWGARTAHAMPHLLPGRSASGDEELDLEGLADLRRRHGRIVEWGGGGPPEPPSKPAAGKPSQVSAPEPEATPPSKAPSPPSLDLPETDPDLPGPSRWERIPLLDSRPQPSPSPPEVPNSQPSGRPYFRPKGSPKPSASAPRPTSDEDDDKAPPPEPPPLAPRPPSLPSSSPRPPPILQDAPLPAPPPPPTAPTPPTPPPPRRSALEELRRLKMERARSVRNLTPTASADRAGPPAAHSRPPTTPSARGLSFTPGPSTKPDIPDLDIIAPPPKTSTPSPATSGPASETPAAEGVEAEPQSDAQSEPPSLAGAVAHMVGAVARGAAAGFSQAATEISSKTQQALAKEESEAPEVKSVPAEATAPASPVPTTTAESAEADPIAAAAAEVAAESEKAKQRPHD